MRWQYGSCEDDDDRGLNETRALACEIVAWRFVAHLSQREAIDYLCTELPTAKDVSRSRDIIHRTESESRNHSAEESHENTPLLDGMEYGDHSFSTDQEHDLEESSASLADEFAGLNALEIAAVAGAKKFLGEKSIQKIVNGIWNGDIVFWNTLRTHSSKKAQIYNKAKSDPYCRLRVPLYLKVFEVVFFIFLLAFYYAVLIPKQSETFTVAEALLYVWLLAFSHNGR